jgi:hypothetical protein
MVQSASFRTATRRESRAVVLFCIRFSAIQKQTSAVRFLCPSCIVSTRAMPYFPVRVSPGQRWSFCSSHRALFLSRDTSTFSSHRPTLTSEYNGSTDLEQDVSTPKVACYCPCSAIGNALIVSAGLLTDSLALIDRQTGEPVPCTVAAAQIGCNHQHGRTVTHP